MEIFRMDDRTHRASHRIEGRSAAPGIALGPLVRLTPVKHDARQHRSAAEERQALLDALAASQLALTVLAREAGDADAEAILSFQIALLEDDNLAAPAFARIAAGEAANRAWNAAIDPEIASYDGASDPYFRARASDLRDLRDRVLRHLAGESHQELLSRPTTCLLQRFWPPIGATAAWYCAGEAPAAMSPFSRGRAVSQ
jgi:phosphoenolpyruvate-protein phosphotransferase (PTS system enzyme I)